MMDQNKESALITLHAGDGTERNFEKVASIRLDGTQYAVLAPTAPMPGLAENQALVFEVAPGDGETARLNLVTDPVVLENIFQEYTTQILRENEDRARR
jgi:uncharacterized protein YrzB (UPF0473 family)